MQKAPSRRGLLLIVRSCLDLAPPAPYCTCREEAKSQNGQGARLGNHVPLRLAEGIGYGYQVLVTVHVDRFVNRKRCGDKAQFRIRNSVDYRQRECWVAGDVLGDKRTRRA